MSQVIVNFRMDSQLKRDMEAVCDELGLSMSAAFTVYAKKVARERRIPFELSADPFYSPANMEHLLRNAQAMDQGNAAAHDLVGEAL